MTMASKGTVGDKEEYDPSQPLDSSDEEGDGPFCRPALNFEKKETTSPQKRSNNNKDSSSDLDLNSIPMPSDEYRRPTIQFSIPTRHRLMSISTLIKRQKGVVKKQDKQLGGNNFNSEVSKAFQKEDNAPDSREGVGDSEDDKPKLSLVHEIFGSDEEDNPKEEENGEETTSAGVEDGTEDNNNDNQQQSPSDIPLPQILPLGEDSNNKWKTLAPDTSEQDGSIIFDKDKNLNDSETAQRTENIGTSSPSEEILISIKPSSELLEAPDNESSSSSPELITLEQDGHDEMECAEDLGGKENKQIVLECISDDDDNDFEVTFVGIGRANLADLRQGRLSRRMQDKNAPSSTSANRSKKSSPPVNGFEEGEIVDKRKAKKDKKERKKKSKKRKRSRESRVSSGRRSDKSNADSPDKRSISDSEDDKEVSWRKPKISKPRNYRNGKRDSEERSTTDRFSKRDEGSTRRRSRSRSRSPNRYSSAFSALKNKPRRRRSVSSPRHRSRSRSKSISRSRSPFTRRLERARRDDINRTKRRAGSYRSKTSDSGHSSPSHMRSRSLTKKNKAKRRPSPSPIRRRQQRSNKSISPSPPPPARIKNSKSPRPRKRNRSTGHEGRHKEKTPTEKRANSPLVTKKASTKASPPLKTVAEDGKKKLKKDKGVEDAEKERKTRKRKRREKSISPVKAIVADGDSIVVSLSFQKPKEDVSKPSKSSSSNSNSNINNNNNINNSNNNCDRSKEKRGSSKNREDCDEIDAPLANHKPTPRKGTIQINLDASSSSSPKRREKESKKSPALYSSDDDIDDDNKGKQGQDQKSAAKDSGNSSSHRVVDGVDCISSSHDDKLADTQFSGSSPSFEKLCSPRESAPTPSSKSPYKFSEFFVSSTCDSTKSSATPPIDHNNSPKTPKTAPDLPDTFVSQKTKNSPFESSSSSWSAAITNNDNAPEKKKTTPSPEITQIFAPKANTNSNNNILNNSSNSSSVKPMIGNIPGLFPSGFSSTGSVVSAPPVIIPTPPKIMPSSTPSNNLINNLVSVASALYAPLLAAKQPSAISRHNSQFSRTNNRTNNGNNNNNNNGEGGDSPFSPNSSDGDDLFEPPSGDGKMGADGFHKKTGDRQSNTNSTSPGFAKYGNDHSSNEKRSLFDSLFSTGPSKPMHSKVHGKQKSMSGKSIRDGRKGKHKKVIKRSDADKNGDLDLSRLDEVPNSAVALNINEKYLKKLNRQERVIEEVKLSLKPHYIKKHVTKEEYKDILRKAVPKICHNKTGEINPNKIKELVEAYVKKVRKNRKSGKKVA